MTSDPKPCVSSDLAAVSSDAGRLHVTALIGQGAPGGRFMPGNGRTEWFRDHADAPDMVVVPRGRFLMGSAEGETKWRGYDGREEPARSVAIPTPFAVSATPITRKAFSAFIAETKHPMAPGGFAFRGRMRSLWLIKDWHFDERLSWTNPGYEQGDDHPVVCVSWEDAKIYCAWLSAKSGQERYRLLSEAEWEYCCRAGTATPYSTGMSITPQQANFSVRRKTTTPVRRFPRNDWGIHDMHGNVWEWVEDGWHESYRGDPPSDGSAWPGGDAVLRGLRGGCWDKGRVHMRSADRGRGPRDLRNQIVGFRVARDL